MVTEHANTQSALLYRIPEAAQMIGVSRSKMYQMVGEGTIRTVKFAGVRRVPAEELIDFVRRLREEGSDDVVAN